jgi:hypothetical protein
MVHDVSHNAKKGGGGGGGGPRAGNNTTLLKLGGCEKDGNDDNADV